MKQEDESEAKEGCREEPRGSTELVEETATGAVEVEGNAMEEVVEHS